MKKRINVYGYDGYLDQDNKGRSFDDILASTAGQDVCGITFRSLKRNKSDALPKVLPSMVNLKYIDLTSCHLTEFPDKLLSVNTLTVLKLAKNDFASLPTDWKSLPDGLRDLDLSDNPLVSLGQAFPELKSLEILNIADCSLSSFPSALTQLQFLRNLNMSGNAISVLPPSMSMLQCMEILNVSGCGLIGVPKVLAKLPNLTSVDLSDNPLTDLPRLLPQALPNIQTLHLCNCGFRFFPEPLLHMKKLNKLDLSRNPITYIPNQLKKSSLYSLTMCNCKLTEITNAISGLHHLDISGNKIKKISDDVLTDLFENDANLKFDSDFLLQPPREILDMGEDATRSYYKELELETALCTNIQSVIILGETGSGKTSLAQTLTSGDPRLTFADDRTVLYENHVFEFDRNLHFQITDLGGHSSYELMYPILMKDKSSIAVVAVDLSSFRKKRSEHDLTRWLQMCVQTLDETSSIIVVGTKADLCTNLPRKEKQITEILADWKQKEILCVEKLLAQSSTIIDAEKRNILLKVKSQLSQFDITLCITSAYENSGISSFVELLLTKTGQTGSVLPKAWVDIYRLFTSKEELFDAVYLPVNDAKAMIKRELKARIKRQRLSPYNIPNGQAHSKHTNIELCLRFFHNRGIILWYEKHQRLKDIIVLRPSLIFETMKLLFQCDITSSLLTRSPLVPFRELTTQHEAVNTLNSCGIASEMLLRCIFRQHGCIDQIPDITIEILKMIGFCYEMTTNYPKPTTSFYFPWFATNNLKNIEGQSHTSEWKDAIPSGSLQLQCHFEFLQRIPLSLFEQLLVQIHSYLYPGHTMTTFSGSVRCIQNGVDILVERKRNCDQTIQLENLVIKMRSDKNDLSELYRMFIGTVRAVKTIVEHCVCILHDQYMVCPHCLLTRQQNPTRLSVDRITMEMNEYLRLAMKSVQCHDTSVPAALYFPQLLGEDNNIGGSRGASYRTQFFRFRMHFH